MPNANRDRQQDATQALQLAFCSIKSGQLFDHNNDAVVSVGDRITYVVKVAMPEGSTPLKVALTFPGTGVLELLSHQVRFSFSFRFRFRVRVRVRVRELGFSQDSG